MFERIFKLSEHKTTVKTEVMAGITTFMTMAYILAVNPSVLGSTGMDTTAVLLATALASCLGTLCMAFMANLPFALSAGMGLNAFMAYTVVAGYGYSWQVALLAVFIEGLIFIVLSLTNVREAIFNAIPLTLKKGVSVGIGLFIAFIGLQNSGLCVDSATLVGIISFPENFHTAGICALLTLIGLFFTAVFYTRKMKGAILYGILLTWILGMLCQVTGLYVPTPDAGFYSLFPSWGMTDFSKLGLTFGQCFNVDFSAVGIVNFIVVIFSFLFVDIFDTLGTLIGVATKAKMLDKDGKPVMKKHWDVTPDDAKTMMEQAVWCPANREYFRGGGYSVHYVTKGGAPVTMMRLNIVKGLGPVLIVAEGWSVDLPAQRVGDFDTELGKEFFLAFVRACPMSLHIRQMAGENTHHILEAVFKGAGRALKMAVAPDEKHRDEIPSTKGVL